MSKPSLWPNALWVCILLPGVLTGLFYTFNPTMTLVSAESQIEHELRLRLQASEEARAVEQKKTAALAETVAQLKAATVKSTDAVQTASNKAVQASQTAQVSAIANTLAIQQASDSAAYAAEGAKTQADQLQVLLNSNFRSTVVIQFTTITLAAFGFLGSWVVASRNRRWAQVDADSQSAKLKQIHALVNSKMTMVMERELAALRAQLMLLETGLESIPNPTAEAIAVIAEVKANVAELTDQLLHRKEQTELADSEVAGRSAD